MSCRLKLRPQTGIEAKMYRVKLCGECPEHDALLWRYLDVARFLAMLQCRGLYFPSISELRLPHLDPMEAFPAGTIFLAPQRARNRHSLEKALASRAAVSCWHENDSESVAMWKLYTSGTEGVAVKTTLGSLKTALESSRHSLILLGRVQYVDYELAGDVIGEGPFPVEHLFHKRRSSNMSRRCGLSFSHLTHPTPGRLCRLFFSQLFSGIVVSPGFPPWAIPALQKIVAETGLNIEIEKSDLLKQPQAGHEGGEASLEAPASL
jgi:hypothetical protein